MQSALWALRTSTAAWASAARVTRWRARPSTCTRSAALLNAAEITRGPAHDAVHHCWDVTARCSDRVDETRELVLGVVVVHRRPRHRVEPARFEVVAGEVDGRHRDVDAFGAQTGRELVDVDAVDGEGDDPALLDADVVEHEPGHRGELRAERRRERRARASRWRRRPAASASSTAAPRPSWVATLRSQLSNRRASSRTTSRSPWRPLRRVHVEERRFQAGQSRSRGRRGTRCPGARAGTCARWPTGSRTPARRRRSGAARRPGTRRAGRARPPRASPRRSRRPGSPARPGSGSTTSPPAAHGRRACRGARRPRPARTRRRGSPRRGRRCARDDLQQPDHVARVLGAVT